MLKVILQGLVVLVLSLALGGVCIYAYNSIFKEKKSSEVPALSLNELFRKNGIVDEIYDDNGVLMDQLAYNFDRKQVREEALKILQDSGLKVKLADERIMVEQGRAGNALDLLMLRGYVPGTGNFAYTDVTAEEGSAEYNVQQQLANQSMLARMIETMSPEISEAEVIFRSEDNYNSISGVQVRITRGDGAAGISVEDLKGIRSNVAAFVSFADSGSIEVIDSATGKEF